MVVAGGLFFATRSSDATVIKVNICHYDGQSGNFQTLNIAPAAAAAHLIQHEADYAGECQEPSPSPIPSPTPSPTPCPEDNEYVLYVDGDECPEEDYCDTLPGIQKEDEDCPKEEEPSPTPEPRVETSGGSYTAPTCNGIYTKPAAFVHVDRVDADSVWVQWANGNDVSRTSILYGYVGGGMDFSVLDLGSDVQEWTINGLEPNKSVNVLIRSWRGECVVDSLIIDP